MPFFYYYDPYYWMILVPAMLIALLAQLNVSSTFNRYSRMASRRGFTGAAFKMCALSGSPAG